MDMSQKFAEIDFFFEFFFFLVNQLELTYNANFHDLL